MRPLARLVPSGLGLVASVLVGALGLGLVYAEDRKPALDLVGRISGFGLRYVTLSGQSETSDSAIVATMGVAPGASLLGIDVDAARERLEALPWITEATVRKVLPGALDVSVTEAAAYARWNRDGSEVVIAEDGTVLADEVPPRYRDLPLVAGRGANLKAPAAREILARHPGLDRRTVAAILVNGRRWNLQLESGATVRLPATDASAALTRLAALEREGSLTGAGPVVIDLRLPDRTTVELSPEIRQAPETLPDVGGDALAEMIAEGQQYDDPLARAIAEAAL